MEKKKKTEKKRGVSSRKMGYFFSMLFILCAEGFIHGGNQSKMEWVKIEESWEKGDIELAKEIQEKVKKSTTKYYKLGTPERLKKTLDEAYNWIKLGETKKALASWENIKKQINTIKKEKERDKVYLEYLLAKCFLLMAQKEYQSALDLWEEIKEKKAFFSKKESGLLFSLYHHFMRVSIELNNEEKIHFFADLAKKEADKEGLWSMTEAIDFLEAYGNFLAKKGEIASACFYLGRAAQTMKEDELYRDSIRIVAIFYQLSILQEQMGNAVAAQESLHQAIDHLNQKNSLNKKESHAFLAQYFQVDPIFYTQITHTQWRKLRNAKKKLAGLSKKIKKQLTQKEKEKKILEKWLFNDPVRKKNTTQKFLFLVFSELLSIALIIHMGWVLLKNKKTLFSMISEAFYKTWRKIKGKYTDLVNQITFQTSDKFIGIAFDVFLLFLFLMALKSEKKMGKNRKNNDRLLLFLFFTGDVLLSVFYPKYTLLNGLIYLLNSGVHRILALIGWVINKIPLYGDGKYSGLFVEGLLALLFLQSKKWKEMKKIYDGFRYKNKKIGYKKGKWILGLSHLPEKKTPYFLGLRLLFSPLIEKKKNPTIDIKDITLATWIHSYRYDHKKKEFVQIYRLSIKTFKQGKKKLYTFDSKEFSPEILEKIVRYLIESNVLIEFRIFRQSDYWETIHKKSKASFEIYPLIL